MTFTVLTLVPYCLIISLICTSFQAWRLSLVLTDLNVNSRRRIKDTARTNLPKSHAPRNITGWEHLCILFLFLWNNKIYIYFYIFLNRIFLKAFVLIMMTKKWCNPDRKCNHRLVCAFQVCCQVLMSRAYLNKPQFSCNIDSFSNKPIFFTCTKILSKYAIRLIATWPTQMVIDKHTTNWESFSITEENCAAALAEINV